MVTGDVDMPTAAGRTVTLSGSWSSVPCADPSAATTASCQGSAYAVDAYEDGQAPPKARFDFSVVPGPYDVYIAYPSMAGLTARAILRVTSALGTVTMLLNQRDTPVGADGFVRIETFDFSGGRASVEIEKIAPDAGRVAADAVELRCVTTFLTVQPTPAPTAAPTTIESCALGSSVVLDQENFADSRITTVGIWTTRPCSASFPCVGTSFIHNGRTGLGVKEVTFSFPLATTGSGGHAGGEGRGTLFPYPVSRRHTSPRPLTP